MSSIINDLNSIYTTKLQIKEILNTNEDVFSYYPDLISAAIASGGASGTIELAYNGTYNVATYAYAYVNVPQTEVPVVPPGYSYVEGGISITENSDNLDVSSYSYVVINVPVPDGYLIPSGFAYITTNGDFDIKDFANVNVNVSGGGVTPTGTKNITANGTVDVSSYAYAAVDVPVPSGYIIPTGTYTITSNGTFDITAYEFGYVNVSGSNADTRDLTYVKAVYDEYADPQVYAYLTKNNSYFTYTGYFWYDSANDQELGEVGFGLYGRVLNETEDDGNGGRQPRFHGMSITQPGGDYLGNVVDTAFGGAIPASGSYVCTAEWDANSAGFYFSPANLKYRYSEYEMNWTLKIPDNYYYTGSYYTDSPQVYLDFTFSGTPA